MGIARPKCEWGGVGGCERPATHVVGFLHSARFRLSCKDHLDEWGKHGRGYWVSRVEAFMGDWEHVISDIIDNQRIGEARNAGAFRQADEYQLERVNRLSASLAD
jgi:hypothetical protein